MRKRICYGCGSAIAVVAVLTLFWESNPYIFIVQILPCIAIFGVLNKCKEAYHFKIMLFFSIWVALYDIFYVILRCFSNVNLFTGDYQVFLQYIVPLMYAFLIRVYSKPSE